jgi:D-alanyl-D-alanine carboxypeptidase
MGHVTRLVAALLVVLALLPLQAEAREGVGRSVRPLPAPLGAQLQERGFWHAGCPVSLSGLRLLTVTTWGFDDQAHRGQLVVSATYAGRLQGVFRRLYELRWPIRHMDLSDMYGPASGRPMDNDISGSFHCRQAVPSPCTGGTRSGHWSNHAYGLAIDLNPRENPYVGCGMSHDPSTRRYMDRSPLRRGMVTPAVVAAFRSIGWGWGGSWTGDTKDYMHFSYNGH